MDPLAQTSASNFSSSKRESAATVSLSNTLSAANYSTTADGAVRSTLDNAPNYQTLTAGELASIFLRPPMLPLIASDSTFITSSMEVLDAINYANSPAIRANLMDAVKCWLSHIDEVLAKYERFEEEWDKIAKNSTLVSFPLAITDESKHLDPRRVLFELKMLETDLSFHDQFQSLPLLACIRILKQIKEAAPYLAKLSTKLVELKEHQTHIITDIQLVETVAEYFFLVGPAKPRSPAWPSELAVLQPAYFPESRRAQLLQKIESLAASSQPANTAVAVSSDALTVASPSTSANESSHKKSTSLVKAKANPPVLSDVWGIEDLSDMMAPLFSSLRALWVCSERFGAKNGKHRRFSSMTRFVIRQVELSVHGACWDVVQRVVDNALPKSITAVKHCLVCAQETIVALQEAFYNLKAHLAEVGPSLDGFHLVYNELDDTMIFGNVEWQYRRITELLEIVDDLRKNVEKVGSKLTDPFEILSAEGDVMSRFHFPDHRFDACARALLSQAAPDPDAIIQSIVNKEAERQKALMDREPRYPLSMLTSHMTIVTSFSPPTVTVVGGPLSHTALDAAQTKLPQCCANKIPDSKHTKMKVEMIFNKVPTPTNQHVQRLVIPEQYCETSLHCTQFIHTILTVVEAELCWNLCGTHALIDPDFGETHYYIFKKIDPTLPRLNGGEATKELEAARAELASLMEEDKP